MDLFLVMKLWGLLKKYEKNINENQRIIKYQNTEDVVNDVCSIIESAREYTYKSVNLALLERNWLIGYRIAEEELKGNGRADYGLEVIKKLSKELTKEYGKGYAFVARQQHIHTEKEDYYIEQDEKIIKKKLKY